MAKRAKRIVDMRPEVTEWDDGGLTHGRIVKIGKWSYKDIKQHVVGRPNRTAKRQSRYIYHYSTLMMEFYRDRTEVRVDHDRDEVYEEWGDWQVSIHSLGHGSVSDQHGINQLVAHTAVWRPEIGVVSYKSYGWYYQRKGGARCRTQDGREVTA